MAKCFIDDTTLTNIGNAIRSVNGSSDLMLPSAMPDVIKTLDSGLYVWSKYAPSNKLILIGEGSWSGMGGVSGGGTSFVLAVLFEDFSGYPYYDSDKNYLGILESSDSIIEGHYYIDKNSIVYYLKSIRDDGASYYKWASNSYYAPIDIDLFIGFSVSNNENAYPDKAVHTDGFYYKKFDSSTLIPENIREGIDIWGVIGTMIEGKPGVDFGEVTLASTATSVTVAHNLGVVPSWVALIPKSFDISIDKTLININGKIAYGGSSSFMKRLVVTNTLIETEIIFATRSDGAYPFAAQDYYWIAIA